MKKLILGMMVAAVSVSRAEVSPYAGLWVGEAIMAAVNEVSVPLDADDVPRAPNPLVPTATGSRAGVRLIVHVDAAGRASLLKDVALVNRNASGGKTATAADIALAGSDEFAVALVSDPRLYAEYPMQKATRFTSVVFDFGDAKATLVLDALVERAVAFAAEQVLATPDAKVATKADRNAAAEKIRADFLKKPAPNDDVAAAYQSFLDALKNQGGVAAIRGTGYAAWKGQAAALTNASASVFADARAADLVEAVRNAATLADAWNMASEFADTGNAAARLLAGEEMGKAVKAGAKYAEENPGAAVSDIRAAAVSGTLAAAVSDAKWADDDTRAPGAVDAIFAAIAAAPPGGAYAAGIGALRGALAKFPGVRSGPGADYTAFVRSAAYAEAPAKAVYAAALAALRDREQNKLTWRNSIENVARVAAVEALQPTYAAAARARQNELPLPGIFALGQGDPRFMLELENPHTLGAAGLSGKIILPANFPTNPFRHRRHPDHTAGFDVARNLRFDFDAADASGNIPTVARGVQSVAGIFRDEFFGLHKPLGMDRDTGLRAEGRFTLNRVSEICVLNAK